MELLQQLSQELKLRPNQVEAAVRLLDEGNTIPFIARYRKEMTDSLDDAALRDLADRLAYLRGLQKRREEVLRSMEEQQKLTPELEAAVQSARTLAEVEDLYRPYKPRRRTRGSIAREKGLEPLAAAIRAQNTLREPLAMAEDYLNTETGVETAEDALAGAMDILAEDISDDGEIRKALRLLIRRAAVVTAAGDDEQNTTYKMYYDFREPVSRIAPHRVLAINRGQKEGLLKTAIVLEEEKALEVIRKKTVTAQNACGRAVAAAGADSWKRLIAPSMENETFRELFETASEQAIRVFAENLHHLLMQPPLTGQVVLGWDPGYRNGCKLAVVDATGRVLDTAVVYPTQPYNRVAEAKRLVTALLKKHRVTVISIGNGTASRESEKIVAELIAESGLPVQYAIVSEAGASVYSASRLASEEFPEYDVNLRSAVSIARRLQDPLAELVKIDPKAIGIGQYQHDMPPARLDAALDGVVESCVNSVGVDLNTASPSLLEHIAGINSAIARNIVAYREENGGFTARSELLKVPKLGKKAYEQCAGFLRISGGKNLLDTTAVHPESYPTAERLLTLCGCTLEQIGTERMQELPALAEKMGYEALAQQLGAGVPTVRDIIAELQKPGRDPRESLPPTVLRSDVLEMKDLKPGMELTGTVRNVVDFGAFVDIGVHEDGLVHISQLGEKYVKHPSEVLKVGDIIRVKVLEVDPKRGRISLTMRGLDRPAAP